MKNETTSGNSATSPPASQPASNPDFLTAEELATVLKISVRTIRRWETEGMPARRRKRVVRFPLAQIREWMKITHRL
jgi:excisionase family DNA binding protein